MRLALACGLIAVGALFLGCDTQEPPSSEPADDEVSDSLTVGLPEVIGEVGDTIAVPIRVDSLDGEEVTSYQFTLPYGDVSEVTGIRVEGAITPSRPVVNNQPEKGEVAVSFASSEPLTGAGTLLELDVELRSAGSAPLAFQNFALFDREAEEVAVALNEGRITAE